MRNELIISRVFINKYRMMSVVLFLINPIISFIFSIYNYLRGKDTSLICAISLAIILSYFPIMYDTSSNFFAEYFNQDKEIVNLYIILAKYARLNLGIQYYQVVFIYNTIGLYCWFKTINYLFFTSKIKNKYLCLLIIPLFSLNYRDIMDLNRNFISYTLCFYCIVYIKENYPKIHYFSLPFFIFISVFFHISSVVIWVGYFLFGKVNFKYRMASCALISSFIIGLFVPTIFEHIQGIFSGVEGGIIGRLEYYLYNSQFGVQEFTVGTGLKKVFNLFFLLSISLCILKALNNKIEDSMINLILMMTSVAFLFSSYVTFFERLLLAITIFYPYIIFRFDAGGNLNKVILFSVFFRTLILTLFIYFPIFFGGYVDVLPDYDSKIKLMSKPFYYNTLFLMDIDNGYSDNYLIKKDKWVY